MKWFKHMSSAKFDPKMMRLSKKYGLRGKGFYWEILESIAFQLSPEKPIPDLEETVHDIASFYGEDSALIQEIAEFCIKENLFHMHPETKRILCLKLLSYLDNTMSNNPEIRKIISNFKKLEETSSDLKQIRLDKIRLDKIRKEDTVRFAPPPIDEIRQYMNEMSYTTFTAESFYNFYESKGWMVGKNKMKDWKKACAGWESRNKSEKKADGISSKEAVKKLREEGKI